MTSFVIPLSKLPCIGMAVSFFWARFCMNEKKKGARRLKFPLNKKEKKLGFVQIRVISGLIRY